MKEQIYELKQTLSELVLNLITRINDIVSLYNSANEKEATARILFLIDDLASLVNGIEAVLKYENVELDIEELNDKLAMLVQQFENQDYLFVSDLLDYELKPLLEHWSEILCLKN